MADNFKRFMTFSRGERIAIITIVLIIVITLIAKYLLIINPPKRTYYLHDLDSIIARREAVLDSVRVADSLAKEASKTNKIPRFARNDKIKHAETKETAEKGFIRSAPLHSDSVEMTISIDINTADTALLKQLPGIGSAFAKRIMSYREKLGGYCETEQLLEVYGMDTARFEKFKNQVKIDLSFIPNKLRINQDAFKVLSKHPYLEFDDVKKIVNHREQKGMIASWEQLVKVVGDAINPKLQYYIDYQ